MILQDIVAVKKRELEQARSATPLKELIEKAASLKGTIRDFKQALAHPGRIQVIAEIKKASPSKGILREDFNPLAIAAAYEACGACAISILTDQTFFQGELSFIELVKDSVRLPILRKDFIIDQYQIYESVCARSDAVLLIAQLLTSEQLQKLYDLCRQLNLAVLCEVHSEEDVEKALSVGAEIIGINNRDLETFKEDLEVSGRLVQKIPPGKIVVSESGIAKARDIQFLKSVGVQAVLVGEAFMRSSDIAQTFKELFGDGQN
ncbi:MAG: indole-3-glycerol phosphate synthase TrpC [Candidatus Omnitrophota bacterium]